MRTIIKSHRFEVELRHIRHDAKATDEFVEAAEWALARRVNIGTQVATDPPVWFLPIADMERVVPVILFYTFDESSVYFLSIQRAPAQSLN